MGRGPMARGVSLKVIHFAGLVDREGNVSAYCSYKPRKIDLNRATWTIRIDAVTCEKCKHILKAKNAGRP